MATRCEGRRRRRRAFGGRRAARRTRWTLVVDARLARSVVAMVGNGAVESWDPSGAVRLRVAVPETDAFVAWVVGLGDTAEVIGPAELRAAVVARLEEMLDRPAREPADLTAELPAPRIVPAAVPPREPPGDLGDETADGAPSAPGRFVPQPQATAGERLNRLLAILVYLARVGEAPLTELAARFSVSASELLHDLELVACCGVPPYTPDQLIDLLIDEDRVVAEGLRELAHPRRFTPEEGFALAAAARALLAVPGGADEADLAGALAKLEAVLGSSALAVEVDSSPALAPLQAAAASGEQVEIDYFGAAASAPSSRVVDPYQVVVREGRWYLDAFCHKANGLRRFQVDRVPLRAHDRPSGRASAP